MIQPLGRILSPFVACSPESILWFRRALGFVCLLSFGTMAMEFSAFYAPNGFPLCHDSLKFASNHFVFPSLLCLCNGIIHPIVFLGIGIFAAIFLLLGIRPRTAALVIWLIHLSFMTRSYQAIYGADLLLGVILFWSIFLAEKETALLPLFLFKIQMVLMYLVTFKLKIGDGWLGDFSAIQRLLMNERYANGLGDFFLQWPLFLKIMTVSALLLEWAAPLVLMFPAENRIGRRLRFSGIAGLTLMHAAIFAFFDIGIFQLISIIALIPFIPPRPEQPTTLLTKSPARDALLATVAAVIVMGYFVRSIPHFRKIPSAFLLNPTWAMMAPDTPRYRVWFEYFAVDEKGEKHLLQKYSEPQDIGERRKHFKTQPVRSRDLHTKSLTYYKGRCDFAKYLCRINPAAAIEQVVHREKFDSGKVRTESACLIHCNSL